MRTTRPNKAGCVRNLLSGADPVTPRVARSNIASWWKDVDATTEVNVLDKEGKVDLVADGEPTSGRSSSYAIRPCGPAHAARSARGKLLHRRPAGDPAPPPRMRFASLGSGSRGNALVVEVGRTRVLLDCGFSATETVARLARLSLRAEDIDAVVVTDEHDDHLGGVARFAGRFRIPVHATAGTLAAAVGCARFDRNARGPFAQPL